MRSPFFVFASLLVCQALSAQQPADTLRGRIVNAAGTPVEYVSIGIPGQKLGTISTRDGQFELVVPRDKAGTVEFHHVSYETYYLPVSDYAKNLTIALSNQELAPAVAHSGKVRERYLLKRGVAFLGDEARCVFVPTGKSDRSGELGSAVNVKHPFRIEEISLPTVSNSIPECVISFNIYRVSDHDSVFENVLTHPIYARVPVSPSEQVITVHPGEDIVLEPGRYFFGLQIVDYSRSSYREDKDGLACKVYLQSSYFRQTPVEKPIPIPINVGLTVKGKEYL